LDPNLGDHLHEGILREEEKKKVVGMTKSLALPRNIQLKEKKIKKV